MAKYRGKIDRVLKYGGKIERTGFGTTVEKELKFFNKVSHEGFKGVIAHDRGFAGAIVVDKIPTSSEPDEPINPDPTVPDVPVVASYLYGTPSNGESVPLLL